jgi:hypothetical protein
MKKMKGGVGASDHAIAVYGDMNAQKAGVGNVIAIKGGKRGSRKNGGNNSMNVTEPAPEMDGGECYHVESEDCNKKEPIEEAENLETPVEEEAQPEVLPMKEKIDGGAKKATEWTKLVKKIYNENKDKPNYKLGDAMKDAKKVYKKK